MDIIKKEIKESLEKEIRKTKGEEPVIFNAGKSCLFQLTPFELINSLQRHPSYVMIYREGIMEGLPVKHLVGKVKLSMGEAFVKAITETQANEKVLPVSAHNEGVYQMENIFGAKSGTIGLFVRLSCFGSTLARPADLKPEDLISQGMVEPSCGAAEEAAAEETRPSMKAVEEQLLSCGTSAAAAALTGSHPPATSSWQREHLPITWRRAERVKPTHFRPQLVELMPALRSLPPAPPRSGPPPDPWTEIAGRLPRCRPGQAPPCYRVPGEAPISPCQEAARRQIRTQDNTKAQQTVPLPVINRLPPTSPYIDKTVLIN